jgi:hypothetical protein
MDKNKMFSEEELAKKAMKDFLLTKNYMMDKKSA